MNITTTTLALATISIYFVTLTTITTMQSRANVFFFVYANFIAYVECIYPARKTKFLRILVSFLFVRIHFALLKAFTLIFESYLK